MRHALKIQHFHGVKMKKTLKNLIFTGLFGPQGPKGDRGEPGVRGSNSCYISKSMQNPSNLRKVREIGLKSQIFESFSREKGNEVKK